MHQALLAAALILPAGHPGTQQMLTSDDLRRQTELGTVLNARVPQLRAADPDQPAWLKMLTPRSASALVTHVASDDLSTTELELRSTHGLRGVPPFVTVTPTLSLLSTDGPTTSNFAPPGPDLPSRLWEVNAGFKAYMPVSDDLTVQVAAAPGLYTDFDNTSSDAFRMPARFLAIYDYSERTQITVGAVYLDRENSVNWLPAIGFVHKPNERTSMELVLPRPRVVHQLWGCQNGHGGFAYVGGDFAGGAWAIERDPRAGVPTDDVVTLNELRALVGFELRRANRPGLVAELGWAFNRELEYASGVGDVELDDGLMFQLGSRF